VSTVSTSIVAHRSGSVICGKSRSASIEPDPNCRQTDRIPAGRLPPSVRRALAVNSSEILQAHLDSAVAVVRFV